MSISVPAGPSASVFEGLSVSEAAAAIAERLAPSVVVVGDRGGNGAGVIWRSDGRIVTNWHVVHGDTVEVTFADGRRLEGKVAARHPDRDLALIQVEANDLPAVEVGDSATVRPGQVVLAIGHPIGFKGAVSIGIVVAAGQAATAEGPRTGDWLQADVALLPGNSGGPLVDAEGRVIGISTMVSGGLSLAIPSQVAERFVAGEQPGQIRAYLGIRGLMVPLRGSEAGAGLLLTEVEEGSPADRAGLLIGDIMTGIDEMRITDQESLPAAVLAMEAGRAVSIAILRGGDPRHFTVVPTERT